MKKIIFAILAVLTLTACESTTSNLLATAGWSGGESIERSRERSGTLDPGETVGPEGVDDSGAGVGFGAISG